MYDLDFVTELWLRAKLKAIPELVAIIGHNTASNAVQVYKDEADQLGSFHPFGIYNNQTRGNSPVTASGHELVLVEAIWQVRFIGPMDIVDKLSEAAQLTITALHNTRQESTAHGRIVECRYNGGIDGPTERAEGGILLTQRGAAFFTKTQRL